jgi:hypothetical protein
MARPRKWDNEAERARAYRRRKREQQELIEWVESTTTIIERLDDLSGEDLSRVREGVRALVSRLNERRPQPVDQHGDRHEARPATEAVRPGAPRSVRWAR